MVKENEVMRIMDKIPKIIHYCWVGGNPKPQSVIYCIDSWKKHCPDYEIIEWNEENYDFSKNKYMKDAYERKKWGFVPDYARLDIVYEQGGVYLDTDVEIIKSLDTLLENQCFFCFEDTGDGENYINCGHGFGAVPHHEVIKNVRDLYDKVSFINEDGTSNLLASPYYTTLALKQYGVMQKNCDQKIRDVQIYASDVLCPKSFRTGQLHKTKRTVSIHHFTASWVDEKIKRELLHQQIIQKYCGKKIGGYVLIAESIIQKYTLKGLITELPINLMKKLKKKLIEAKDSFPYYWNLVYAKMKKCGTSRPVILDTSMESDNCGDNIIMNYCLLQLDSCVNTSDWIHVPTHRYINETEKIQLTDARMKLLCGTNILSGQMRSYGLWKINKDISPYKNTILMGVGFDSMKEKYDSYTKMFFHTILAKDKMHSVRDSFAEEKLHSMGIDNVINTGCPTMWNLTPELCSKIPRVKGKDVVCTITDYCPDERNDRVMLDVLIKNYEKVYVWLQGANDRKYIERIEILDKVELIGSTLKEYDQILEKDNLDYVGTRLHAGIRAMNKGHRSLIISIDNRAECISKDTGLPIIKREDVPVMLEEYIEQDFDTYINMPWENIEKWKQQFD